MSGVSHAGALLPLSKPGDHLVRHIVRIAQGLISARFAVRASRTAAPAGAVEVVRTRAIARVRGNGLANQEVSDIGIGELRSAGRTRE